MEASSTFAERLRTLRENAGMSQYALAKKAGLSNQALSALELGKRQPTWETVQLLAAALGQSCEAFTDPGLKLAEVSPGRPRGRPRKADVPAKGKKGKK